MFKKEYIFNLRKVSDKDGIYIRQTPDLKSSKVIDNKIPYNSLIALKYPLNIINIDNKSRVEVLRPVKGWVFLDDLISLDYFEYLRFGLKYEKILNEQIKLMGKENFINQNYLIDSNTIQVFTIKDSKEENEKDLIKLMNFDSVLKDLELNKDIDENFTVEDKLSLTDYKHKISKFKKPVLIYFGASWCGPCINFRPKLIKVVKKIGGIKLYLIDSDNTDLLEEFKLNRIPKLYFIKDGKIINEISGFSDDIKLLEKSLKEFKNKFESEKDEKEESNLSKMETESIKIITPDSNMKINIPEDDDMKNKIKNENKKEIKKKKPHSKKKRKV